MSDSSSPINQTASVGNDTGTLTNDTGSVDADDAGINVVGLVSLLVFYGAVLAIGVWAGWKQRRDSRIAGTSNDQATRLICSNFRRCTRGWLGGREGEGVRSEKLSHKNATKHEKSGTSRNFLTTPTKRI